MLTKVSHNKLKTCAMNLQFCKASLSVVALVGLRLSSWNFDEFILLKTVDGKLRTLPSLQGFSTTKLGDNLSNFMNTRFDEVFYVLFTLRLFSTMPETLIN